MSQDDEQDQGVGLWEFVEFYLLDSQEQIERLGSGLLQLEKEGGNIELINELFRSAHSLKGASGTMGFTPIVALIHVAEDLLDHLRQGKMDVSVDMIDILLAVTDRVKVMLAQVEQRQEITIEFEDLASSMRGLINAPKGIGKTTGASTTEISNGDENTQVHTLRVDRVQIDNLMNLVGEMVITQTRLVQIGWDLKVQYSTNGMVNQLNEGNIYLDRLMNDLQESVMHLRMVEIGTVFNRFPRLVRDLAKKTGKEIDLVLKGAETELDKTVAEVIGDPLMHLIRNSVDHGIELPEERRAAGKPGLGTITLNAYHEGNHLAILISDDGAGLDLPKIRQRAVSKGFIGEREVLSERDIANLIFLPGVSTFDVVTDISGRGVGMDIVKKALSDLGGRMDITTREGMGSTFTIRLPVPLGEVGKAIVE